MRPAVDPDRPNNTVLATKVPDEDASFLAFIAREANMSKSEVVRLAVQERLRRERLRREQEPPDQDGQTPDN